MRAAVFVPPSPELEIEDVSSHPLAPHEARVKILASGVCRSDLSIAHSHYHGIDAASAPPMVLGHEGAGTVIEVGPDVTKVKVGDLVISTFYPQCGECWYCLHGLHVHCERGAELRTSQYVTRHDHSRAMTLAGLGTFAEEMTAHEYALIPVETSLPAEQLALIGCAVTTGVGAALWSARVQPGDSVAVFGCGGVGGFAVQGARIAGATQIIAVDPVAMKREQAAAAGATDLVDPNASDPIEQVRALTAGRGVDHAFEITGIPSVIMQAYGATRVRGNTVVVGMSPGGSEITLDAGKIYSEEKRLMGSYYGSHCSRRNFPEIVALAEIGRLDIGSAVTRRIKLEEVNEAFRAIEDGAVIRSVIC